MNNRQVNYEVTIDGKKITLDSRNFLTAGGEAMIYKHGKKIIKIYHDVDKMVNDGMIDKMKMLSNLGTPSIIAPKGTVNDVSGKPLGFWMPFVEGEPLPRIFTSSFWLRNSFNFVQASHLVSKMRDIVQHAHNHGAVIVDPNEVNWLANLAGKNGPDPIIIDVDSWSIGRWKTHTLMLHICDYHNKSADFTVETDWFSWGVVTFQVYTGIHPYRGILSGYSDQIDDIVKRMKENKSVFSPNVKLNRSVRDFNEIPKPLLSWYQATFDQGERTAPPSPYDKTFVTHPITLVQRIITTGSGSLKYEKLFDQVPIKRVFPCGVVHSIDGELFDLSTKRSIGFLDENGEIIEVAGGWLCAWLKDNRSKFSFINANDFSTTEIIFDVTCSKLFRADNRLFLVNSNLYEVNFINIGKKPLVSVNQSVQLALVTQWFDAVGIQESVESKFLILPFGDKSCTIIRVKDLDNQTVITAKAGIQFAVVVTLDKKGGYHKHEFTFAPNYTLIAATQSSIAGPDLNLTILPSRVAATIMNDGELVVFVPINGKVTKVSDKHITTDKILANWGNKVLYNDNGAIWHVSM